jgi:tRNA-dihydrouridine synthase
MRDLLPIDRPALVLAPMQDVTDLPFLRVLARRGGPDYFVTEYFRVYPDSRLDPYILRSLDENQTGRPIFAQMIGADIPSLVRTAGELLRHPVAGIDLNLGCPSPTVCRKDAGGGLLRNPAMIDRILGALREKIAGRFTVKTRLGYHTPEEFEGLLAIFRSHRIDALTIHARTVVERYQSPVHPEFVRLAAESLSCPVIANGNVVNVAAGKNFLARSGCAGLMIGRGAIRNPWLFDQLRATFAGIAPAPVLRRDLLHYALELYDEIARETRVFHPGHHVQRMKRTMVYLSQGIDPDFEHRIRRAQTPDDFHSACHDHLDNGIPVPETPPERSKIFCGFAGLAGTA